MKNNFVAKHAHRFNKAAVMVDKKREERKGYRKHKVKDYEQTKSDS